MQRASSEVAVVKASVLSKSRGLVGALPLSIFLPSFVGDKA